LAILLGGKGARPAGQKNPKLSFVPGPARGGNKASEVIPFKVHYKEREKKQELKKKEYIRAAANPST